MRKRLRKKLRRGEFQELGFRVRFRRPPGLTEKEASDFWYRLVLEVIEGNGLECGGGGAEVWEFTVGLFGRGSATEAQRLLVLQWLEGQPGVRDVEAGGLFDLWWPPEDADYLSGGDGD